MRPGAFLTHGLLSLVTNVVSDISLASPLSHLSIPPGILVASPGRSSTLTKSGSHSPSSDGLGGVWCRGPFGSTKTHLPVLFTAEPLEGTCALDRSQILREDEIRAVYLSPCSLMFLRLLSQAFNPFVSLLPFICDLVF